MREAFTKAMFVPHRWQELSSGLLLERRPEAVRYVGQAPRLSWKVERAESCRCCSALCGKRNVLVRRLPSFCLFRHGAHLNLAIELRDCIDDAVGLFGPGGWLGLVALRGARSADICGVDGLNRVALSSKFDVNWRWTRQRRASSRADRSRFL